MCKFGVSQIRRAPRIATIATIFSGVIYCSARWYDPSTSRWLSVDPLGFAGGTSVYAYAGGDPVSWVAPSGYDPGLLPTGPSGGPRLPPGYNQGWTQGTDARGDFVQDPAGNKWYPHSNDPAHWGHDDEVDPCSKKVGGYPRNSLKVRTAIGNQKAQKRAPRGDQSATDPWAQDSRYTDFQGTYDDGFWVPFLVPWGDLVDAVGALVGAIAGPILAPAPALVH
ncbi:MAG: RHS repeat-associated core domain-containing protein [Capsulimonadaceae bacterium]